VHYGEQFDTVNFVDGRMISRPNLSRGRRILLRVEKMGRSSIYGYSERQYYSDFELSMS